MTLLLVFSLCLLLAVLISQRAERTVLSTAVLFLLTGMVAASPALHLLTIKAFDPIVQHLAELALFSVLFTDGMKLQASTLLRSYWLPLRALAMGLPLTIVAAALLAHFITGLPWLESLLLGAILSPTDPVFVAAIVGREEIPARLRNLLNVESGLNDGLALPVVLLLLAHISSSHVSLLAVGLELAGGLAVGVVIPWVALKIETFSFFAASASYVPLLPVSIGLLVLATCWETHANEYLAAFAAGICTASFGPMVREEFHGIGETVTELLKLAALMVFGALFSVSFFGSISWEGYLFAILMVVAVRPVTLILSFLWPSLTWPEFATAAWFGPKGFASVTYALIVLNAKASLGDVIFRLAALVIGISIVAHSSSDVPVAKWLVNRSERR